jgi:hypothetical protein
MLLQEAAALVYKTVVDVTSFAMTALNRKLLSAGSLARWSIATLRCLCISHAMTRPKC